MFIADAESVVVLGHHKLNCFLLLNASEILDVLVCPPVDLSGSPAPQNSKMLLKSHVLAPLSAWTIYITLQAEPKIRAYVNGIMLNYIYIIIHFCSVSLSTVQLFLLLSCWILGNLLQRKLPDDCHGWYQSQLTAQLTIYLPGSTNH